jgi:hypothetical protein
MKWRGLYKVMKPLRVRHLWHDTEEYIWYAYCGLKMETYLILSKSYAEPKCDECERLFLKEKAEKSK